jgi:hypothetical protein
MLVKLSVTVRITYVDNFFKNSEEYLDHSEGKIKSLEGIE